MGGKIGDRRNADNTIGRLAEMLKFLKYWFWDIDEAPHPIGPIGFAIMGIFLLFCIGMLIYHDLVHR